MVNVKLTAPVSWHELSPAQVLFVSKQYLIGVNREELLTRCFLKFADVTLLKHYPFVNDKGQLIFALKHKGLKFTLTAEELHFFCERLAFLTDSIGLMQCPQIKGYKAPDYRLFNHSLEQYLTADNYYMQFSHTKTDGINELVATLYRTDDKPYNDNDIYRLAKKAGKLKQAVKVAVYLWFTGFKVWLRQHYPLVFAPSDEAGETPPDKIIFGLLESLNDGKPHYNERILKTHVHEVFYSLNAKIEQADKIKEYKA